jgi:hypothetical protein
MAVGGLLAALGGVTAVADAATVGTLSGVACRSLYDNTQNQGKFIFHDPNGLSTTDTTWAKSLTCPIQRVNGLSTTGISNTYVSIYESHASLRSSCTLNAYDEYGNQVSSTSTATSGGQGLQELILGNLSTSDAWGVYSLVCTLMPRASNGAASMLYSYEWNER